jgi:transcriptional regulator with XRE-family HTH domain
MGTEDLGGYLARMRKRQGWTIREASRHAGISDSYLGQVERGQKAPRAGILWVLADAYSLTALERSRLFELAGYPLDRQPDRSARMFAGMTADDFDKLEAFAREMARRLRDQG